MKRHHAERPKEESGTFSLSRSRCKSPPRAGDRLLIGLLAAGLVLTGRAAELRVTAPGAFPGDPVSLSGTNGLTSGSDVFLFRNIESASGPATQPARLVTPTGASLGGGFDIPISGNIALAGSPNDDVGTTSRQGLVYLFRNLDTVTGAVTPAARLLASDPAVADFFGASASISGTIGLIGSGNGSGGFRGAAYVFRYLDTATGTVTQSAKLLASDGAANHLFGNRSSVSGTVGLVGAEAAAAGRGAAYLFRNLHTATVTVTENARLIASDGVLGDSFGFGISSSGNNGLVGAYRHNDGRGAAYLFRGLDSATGTIMQNAKLIASDAAPDDEFGRSLSLSGANALVGAAQNVRTRGAAYLYLDVNAASGTVTETVKLTPSSAPPRPGENQAFFGAGVSVDGDRFLIAATGAGKVYSGTISSFTTADAGNLSGSISGLSFNSRTDWIVGATTDANHVRLGLGDRADVTGAGKAVYIGQNAGSDSNTLTFDGALITTEVYIGALAGNLGNTLQLEDTATFQAIAFRLAPDNFLKIEGNYTAIDALFAYLGTTNLQVWDDSAWQTVNSGNYAQLISSSFAAGYTTLVAIPEPSAAALLLACLGPIGIRRRRAGE